MTTLPLWMEEVMVYYYYFIFQHTHQEVKVILISLLFVQENHLAFVNYFCIV